MISSSGDKRKSGCEEEKHKKDGSPGLLSKWIVFWVRLVWRKRWRRIPSFPCFAVWIRGGMNAGCSLG